MCLVAHMSLQTCRSYAFHLCMGGLELVPSWERQWAQYTTELRHKSLRTDHFRSLSSHLRVYMLCRQDLQEQQVSFDSSH